MSAQLPPEIAEAIQRIDAAIPEALLSDWKKVRGYCRAKLSESHRVLPAASIAVQEIAQVRQHAQNAMDAMAGVFGQAHSPDEVPTSKHKKPPDDKG
jgi:hypothetical protein